MSLTTFSISLTSQLCNEDGELKLFLKLNFDWNYFLRTFLKIAKKNHARIARKNDDDEASNCYGRRFCVIWLLDLLHLIIPSRALRNGKLKRERERKSNNKAQKHLINENELFPIIILQVIYYHWDFILFIKC